MAHPVSTAFATALIGAAWAIPAPAQPAGPGSAVSPAEPVVSVECRAPAASLYAPGALPRLAEAVRTRGSVRVLALGALPAASSASAPGSRKYSTQLHLELERALPGVRIAVEARRLPGEITAGAPEAVTHAVMENQPDLVVWSAGTHDALARTEIDTFVSEVDRLLQWMKHHGLDVVIVEPPYAAAIAEDEHYSALVRALRAVAERHQVPVVLRYEAMRYLSGAPAQAAELFRLHDLSRRCIPEYVAAAVQASLSAAGGGAPRTP
jgi:acyl-CoA thioesterase I